jgi:low temperature requirement protein LtrA
MQAPDGKAPPPRSGLRRLIRPWEYRHLHAVMAAHFAGGGFQLGIGLVLVSLGRQAGTTAERRKCYRLAAWFLVPAALNFAGGLLDLAAARTAPPRT